MRELKKWESVGCDRVNFLLNALETVPQQKVLDSLRLFAKEVMPHFQGASDSAGRRRRPLMPPRSGKLDLATWSRSAPTINGYKTGVEF